MGLTLCRWNNWTIFLRMHRTRPLSLQREEMRYPVISSPLITTSLSRDSGVNFSESEQPHTTARSAPTTRPVLFNAQNMTNTPTPTPPCGKGVSHWPTPQRLLNQGRACLLRLCRRKLSLPAPKKPAFCSTPGRGKSVVILGYR